MTRVKICGCMRVQDAMAAKKAGADFVGLMFAPSSRRKLSIERAQAIVTALADGERRQPRPPLLSVGADDDIETWFQHGADALDRILARRRPLTVGVFEDQPLEAINSIADACGLDMVQLSGDESWADCVLANRQVVKTVETPVDIAAEDVVDGMESGTAIACLLDGSRGRGRPVNLEVAAAIAAELPVWLAGGLTPENVSATIRRVKPWAVDVSSGVETDGVKDAKKIHAFVSAAKGQ